MIAVKEYRKSVKALELLTINGLCYIVDVSNDTMVEWMEDFNVYIPKTEDMNITYYHPEAIDVLKFIKKCKAEDYQNGQITEMLANRNIFTTTDSPLEEIQNSIDEGSHKENILTMMQTIGKTVSNVASQEKEIRALKQVQREQTKEINNLKREMEALKQQQTTTSVYETRKKSFTNLFRDRRTGTLTQIHLR
ncbi:MerR family transcriptional regulator [Oceanobacillus rekensis]|uniref:MerR family transcriptional regulator n=1 Tax=Oceanobacillus rekensis TaxID=937927 RepID=UPI000B43B5AB|nr:MerR family transcriptional regulator [Oceanobacillus rekensis]